eukprot:6101400-Alexandrium_andersonii.AAC.1
MVPLRPSYSGRRPVFVVPRDAGQFHLALATARAFSLAELGVGLAVARGGSLCPTAPLGTARARGCLG